MDKYAKAIVGALVALVTAVAVGLADSVITAEEWALAGVAFLTALGTIWGVPNAPDDDARIDYPNGA